MPVFPPTDEQFHILDLLLETDDNIQIEAYAGCIKTSTLELIHEYSRVSPILSLAFNTRIKDRMIEGVRERTEDHGMRLPPITIKTINGFGHGIWAQACGSNLSVDTKKTRDLLRLAINDLPRTSREEAYDNFWQIISAVGLAKSLGYVPTGKFPNAKRLITADEFYARLEEAPSELVIDLIEEVLLSSIKASYAGSIDFDDQIYMPALFGGSFPRFPLVLVDEEQDLNPVNHEMLGKLTKSRIVAVGDPWQSIYAFRGAVQGGMAKLKSRLSMTEASLTVSFRCPEQIVRAVHWRVPEMKWSKPGGRVARLRNPDHSSFPDSCAILCRNNAPLFALAIKLITAGRSVRVHGSDIGPKVAGIMRKLGDEGMNRKELLNAIEDWRQEKLSKESTTANDIADCMRVFANLGDSLGQALGYAEHLFEQEGTIHLLTGHKAKGLEWPVIYHLDPWHIGRDEQELNLSYVIRTRASSEAYEIDSKEIRW